MIRIDRTNSDNQDFQKLVSLLDADLAKRDGEEHAFYHQYNTIDALKHTVVIYENESPVGCGAMKLFEPGIMEIKRMYTVPEFRGMGLATMVLNELESWASVLNHVKCVLETGKRQPEVIRFYLKNGYKTISNYGQYAGINNSVCLEKRL